MSARTLLERLADFQDIYGKVSKSSLRDVLDSVYKSLSVLFAKEQGSDRINPKVGLPDINDLVDRLFSESRDAALVELKRSVRDYDNRIENVQVTLESAEKGDAVAHFLLFRLTIGTSHFTPKKDEEFMKPELLVVYDFEGNFFIKKNN